MPHDDPDASPQPARSRGRLRRTGRSMVRLGAVLAGISLVVTLLAGWATRSMLDHLQDNSAELLDGTATVSLSEGTHRTLYVTGGLVAPGELAPTPVEQISCTVTGPDGAVPFDDRTADGAGINTVLARFQVVGGFDAPSTGDYQIDCSGLGVVVAPQVSPASALARLGGLMLGSLGAFLGVMLLLLGGALLLLVRGGHGPDDEDDAEEHHQGAPPVEGADEWWQDDARPVEVEPGQAVEDEQGQAVAQMHHPGREADDDDYVELTEQQLAALSDDEIEEMVASGALIFEDDEGEKDDER